MNYSKYTRSFIILDDKKSNFRNTNENIKGHVKIEMRNNQGTLKCNVQNLKYYEDARYLYKLYFFGKKDNNTIFTNTGTLYIDKQGRGEHFVKFNPLNLDDQGNELYDFSILAVIAQPNKDILEDDAIFPVLTGYLSKESRSSSATDDQLINLSSKDDKKSEAPHIPEKAKESTSPATAAEVVEEPILVQEEKEEEKTEEKEVKENEVKEKEMPKTEKPFTSNALHDDALKPLSKKTYDTSRYFSNYVRTVSTNLEKVLSFYNKTEPFEYDRVGCKWWKIINLMSIPFANTSYLQGYPEHMRPYNMNFYNPRELCPSCHDLIYKYQHYLFGIEQDENNRVKSYYYGIPGRYMKEEQPDNGKSGFEYWQPLQGKERKVGDYGYWILSVNGKTGQFEIPVEG